MHFACELSDNLCKISDNVLIFKKFHAFLHFGRPFWLSQGRWGHKFDLFINVPSIPISGEKQYPETPSHYNMVHIHTTLVFFPKKKSVSLGKEGVNEDKNKLNLKKKIIASF